MTYNYVKQHKTFDVIIVGAGLVGNSFACMLAHQGFKVALVEAKPKQAAANDNRSLVLTHTSYQILKALGIWSAIAPNAYPIERVHVSHLGHFGACRFEAADFKMPVFGYVIPAVTLTHALEHAVSLLADITFLCPADVIAVQHKNDLVCLEINSKDQVTTIVAPLVVAADGTQSKIRTLENITTKKYDYEQTAIIAQVSLAQDHEFTAYERLTPSGPLAILPRDGKNCGLVWTVANTQVASILALSDTEFLAQLQQRFGYRLGKLMAVTERRHYPLQLLYAAEQSRAGLVLLGNAAHTLHPLAGQGFNLGLRDAATLAEVLVQAHRNNQPLGEKSVLKEYEHWRQQDQQNTIRFTDWTVRLFAHEILGSMSSLGLLTLNSMPILKRRLLKKLMGLTAKTPRLFVGVVP